VVLAVFSVPRTSDSTPRAIRLGPAARRRLPSCAREACVPACMLGRALMGACQEGAGRLHLADAGRVDRPCLSRQVLVSAADVGASKVRRVTPVCEWDW
jgi:hypothetical protein